MYILKLCEIGFEYFKSFVTNNKVKDTFMGLNKKWYNIIIITLN